MFEPDICFCVSRNICPFADHCRRGVNPNPGIYTMADFYKEGYKKERDCEGFLPDIEKIYNNVIKTREMQFIEGV